MPATCKHGAPWWRDDCPLCGRDLSQEARERWRDKHRQERSMRRWSAEPVIWRRVETRSTEYPPLLRCQDCGAPFQSTDFRTFTCECSREVH